MKICFEIKEIKSPLPCVKFKLNYNSSVKSLKYKKQCKTYQAIYHPWTWNLKIWLYFLFSLPWFVFIGMMSLFLPTIFKVKWGWDVTQIIFIIDSWCFIMAIVNFNELHKHTCTDFMHLLLQLVILTSHFCGYGLMLPQFYNIRIDNITH
jgi:hypothetical protein